MSVRLHQSQLATFCCLFVVKKLFTMVEWIDVMLQLFVLHESQLLDKCDAVFFRPVIEMTCTARDPSLGFAKGHFVTCIFPQHSLGNVPECSFATSTYLMFCVFFHVAYEISITRRVYVFLDMKCWRSTATGTPLTTLGLFCYLIDFQGSLRRNVPSAALQQSANCLLIHPIVIMAEKESYT